MPLIMGILAQGVGAAPTAAGAYDLLETVEPSSVSSVTFTGLGAYSDYRHLQVRMVGRTTDTGFTAVRVLQMTFNGDTGSNYSRHQLLGNGSSVTSGGASSTTSINANNVLPADDTVANSYGVAIIDILDFNDINKNTTARLMHGVLSNATYTPNIYLSSGAWYNTSAVTSISFAFEGKNIKTGSRFSLYGVK